MRIENDILIPELARLIAEGKEVRFTPSGNSMRPFIEGDKDSVILAPLTHDPKVGDIILAQAETLCGRRTYVLHRLIRIEKKSPFPLGVKSPTRSDCRWSSVENRREEASFFVLQGDGNLSGEESCTRGDIIGRVVRIESPSGRRKPLTRGLIWYWLKPLRKYLLKIYRKLLKLF